MATHATARGMEVTKRRDVKRKTHGVKGATVP